MPKCLFSFPTLDMLKLATMTIQVRPNFCHDHKIGIWFFSFYCQNRYGWFLSSSKLTTLECSVNKGFYRKKE
jgi:hypothetical protein